MISNSKPAPMKPPQRPTVIPATLTVHVGLRFAVWRQLARKSSAIPRINRVSKSYRTIPRCTIVCNHVTDSRPKATNLLAQQLCGPVYQNTPSLGSAVSSAIASATAVAASLKSLDPTKSESYPICAVSRCASRPSQWWVGAQLGTRELTINQQKCQNASIPASGCGSLSNRACVCKSPSTVNSNSNLGACERAACSASDLQGTTSSLSFLLSPFSLLLRAGGHFEYIWILILCRGLVIGDLANALCYPVGGIGNTTNSSYTTSASTPTPSAFTGDATAVMARSLGWGVMGFVGGLGWLVLLWSMPCLEHCRYSRALHCTELVNGQNRNPSQDVAWYLPLWRFSYVVVSPVL